jgi:hypothetical protein
MPHNLATYNGQTMMMFVGLPPWHRLGTPLSKPVTAEEAIKAAHLDWEVIKAPLYAVKDGICQRYPHKYAVVRKDLWSKNRARRVYLVHHRNPPSVRATTSRKSIDTHTVKSGVFVHFSLIDSIGNAVD